MHGKSEGEGRRMGDIAGVKEIGRALMEGRET